jgi:ribosomal protein S6
MQYELSFLTPNLSSQERDELFQKIEEEIKSLDGEIEEKFIEKKLFAYLVKKQREGFLGVINFSIEKNKIKELCNFLELNKNILREMIEKKERPVEALKTERRRRKPYPAVKKPPIKKEKVKIEELDKKLEEILK